MDRVRLDASSSEGLSISTPATRFACRRIVGNNPPGPHPISIHDPFFGHPRETTPIAVRVARMSRKGTRWSEYQIRAYGDFKTYPAGQTGFTTFVDSMTKVVKPVWRTGTSKRILPARPVSR